MILWTVYRLFPELAMIAANTTCPQTLSVGVLWRFQHREKRVRTREILILFAGGALL